MVGKRLWPEGVHFKLRSVDDGSSNGGWFLEDGRNDAESSEKREKSCGNMEFVLHCFPPPIQCGALQVRGYGIPTRVFRIRSSSLRGIAFWIGKRRAFYITFLSPSRRKPLSSAQCVISHPFP